MDYGVETIKRQTRAAYGSFVAGRSPCSRARTTAYRLYACSVCNTKALMQLQYQYVAS